MTEVIISPEQAAEAISLMNDHQQPVLLNFARVLAGAPWAQTVRLTAVDAAGFELLMQDDNGRRETSRLSFAQPVADADGLRWAFIQLADEADRPDGAIREAAAVVPTPKASRYLKALCNHFDRKGNASYDDNEGHVQFPFGTCDFRADDATLHIHVSADTDTRLTRVKMVVADHLIRFAASEDLTVDWVAPETTAA